MFVYTSKTDFCVLTLYPALCQINLLALTEFLWVFKDFLYIRPYQLGINIILPLSFQFGCLFFLSCLVSLARTSMKC